MTGEPSSQASFVPPASISFGRFEEESLSWERRSPFSHNRYLEEAEKCASPGSVTQKKAFFETQFKQKDLPHHDSVDYENGITGGSNETKNPDNRSYMNGFDQVQNAQHAWFDEKPNSNENTVKVELQLSDFESTFKKEKAGVVASLRDEFNTVSAGFDFVMDKVHSPATSLDTHQVHDERHPSVSSSDARYLEDGYVDFAKPEDRAESAEKLESLKHLLNNVELCDEDTEKCREANHLVNNSNTSTGSKLNSRSVQCQNLSMKGSRVAVAIPLESNLWKAEKSSETISRRQTELSTTKKHNVQPLKAASSRRNGAKQELRISLEGCSASGISKGNELQLKGTELLKQKQHQEHKRRPPDVSDPNRRKQDLKGLMLTSRPKHGITLSKMDNEGVLNSRSDEREETMKVDRLARPPSACVGVKPTSTFSRAASRLGFSRTNETVDAINSVGKTSSISGTTSIKTKQDDRFQISSASRHAERRHSTDKPPNSVPHRRSSVKLVGEKARSRVLKSEAKPIKSVVTSEPRVGALVVTIASEI